LLGTLQSRVSERERFVAKPLLPTCVHRKAIPSFACGRLTFQKVGLDLVGGWVEILGLTNPLIFGSKFGYKFICSDPFQPTTFRNYDVICNFRLKAFIECGSICDGFHEAGLR